MERAIIIIPTYNEEAVIAETIVSVIDACKIVQSFEVGVLVVDSASQDNTVRIVKELQQKYPQLYCIEEEQKLGLGNAYMYAMEYAIQQLKADIVFEFDADGSHGPHYIPQMLEEIKKGADVVVGSRYVPGGSIPKDWAFHRKLLSVLGNIIAQVFLSRKYKDWTSGFRASRTVSLLKTPYTHLLSKTYAYKIHLLWLLHKSHAKVVELPIKFIDRQKGYSKLPKWNAVTSLVLVIWLRILEMRYFIKMAAVGSIGMLVQFIIFNILRLYFHPSYAIAIAGEFAILCNFILNNTYSFKDKKLSHKRHGKLSLLKKGISFNLLSLISLGIQVLLMKLSVDIFGRHIIIENITTLVGIVLGSLFNYFTYSRFIWKIK